MARGGIRLVHGHTKSTLITYFSGMKIDPNYAFLNTFFLICPSCPFQNIYIWPKTHPFFPIFARFCPPKRCTCEQCLVLKNNPNYVNFWTSLIPPLTFEWPPREICTFSGLVIGWWSKLRAAHPYPTQSWVPPRALDPSFFKENPLPYPTFGNPCGTYSPKKKLSAPPRV